MPQEETYEFGFIAYDKEALREFADVSGALFSDIKGPCTRRSRNTPEAVAWPRSGRRPTKAGGLHLLPAEAGPDLGTA